MNTPKSTIYRCSTTAPCRPLIWRCSTLWEGPAYKWRFIRWWWCDIIAVVLEGSYGRPPWRWCLRLWTTGRKTFCFQNLINRTSQENLLLPKHYQWQLRKTFCFENIINCESQAALAGPLAASSLNLQDEDILMTADVSWYIYMAEWWYRHWGTFHVSHESIFRQLLSSQSRTFSMSSDLVISLGCLSLKQ